jgi:hypothetical protein
METTPATQVFYRAAVVVYGQGQGIANICRTRQNNGKLRSAVIGITRVDGIIQGH